MSDPPSTASVGTNPSASDAVIQALSRLSSATRGSTSVYGNVRASTGRGGQPQRLMSGIGFPESNSFSYIVPASALTAAVPAPRAITSVTLHPYGLVDDHRTITSALAIDRRIRTTSSDTAHGMRPYPSNAFGSTVSDYLICANSDDNTYAPLKTARVLDAMASSQRGPAYHFVISRNGDVVVGAPLDSTTTASQSPDATVDIALEGGFAISRANHTSKSFAGNLLELPYTPIQVLSLTVLIVKLRTSYPAIPTDLASGVLYDWTASAYSNATQLNFSGGAWRNGVSPFSHVLSDSPAFFDNFNSIAPFDLATEVFQLNQGPPAIVTRAPVQTAIGTADTMGQQSVLLGNYATIASRDRSADMQGASRISYFVERSNVAVRDADDQSSASGDVSQADPPPTTSPATNIGPSTYDYATGRWADDGQPY